MGKKKKNYPDHVIFHSDISDIDKGGAASANECTGLISQSPRDESERMSYEDIIDYSADDAGKGHNDIL